MHTFTQYEPIFELAEVAPSSAFNDKTLVENGAGPFLFAFDPSRDLLRTYKGLAVFFRSSVRAVMLIKILLRMTYDQIDPNTCQTLLEYAHQPVPAPMLCNNQVNTQVQIGDTFVFHSLLSFYHGDMSLMRGEWCKVGSVDFLVRMLKRERIDTSNEIYRKFEAEHAMYFPYLLSRELEELSMITGAESEKESAKAARKPINVYEYQLKRNAVKNRRYNGPYKIFTRKSPLNAVVSSSDGVQFDGPNHRSTNFLGYHQPETVLPQLPAYSNNDTGSLPLSMMQPPEYQDAIQSSLTAFNHSGPTFHWEEFIKPEKSDFVSTSFYLPSLGVIPELTAALA